MSRIKLEPYVGYFYSERWASAGARFLRSAECPGWQFILFSLCKIFVKEMNVPFFILFINDFKNFILPIFRFNLFFNYRLCIDSGFIDIFIKFVIIAKI